MHDGLDPWLVRSIYRRQLFYGMGAAGVAVGLLPLLRRLPSEMARSHLGRPGVHRFFDGHQWEVVEEALARLIPGPRDDPAEKTPGAREIGVVVYVDRMLSAFDADPPLIYAGGPWSDRSGSTDNPMSQLVPLRPWEEDGWRARIAGLRDTYRVGVAELDAAAGGDFNAVDRERRDEILVADTSSLFRRVLFVHAVEGMYAVPEYGGNSEMRGWKGIGFRGDVAPSGWTDEQVRESDGRDAVPMGFKMPFPAQLIDDGPEAGGGQGR